MAMPGPKPYIVFVTPKRDKNNVENCQECKRPQVRQHARPNTAPWIPKSCNKHSETRRERFRKYCTLI